ncbi:VaFE repeat-containing surface-anchored protein [Micrococcales bacterium 31B]|nr:VaFE repeat-containing surface-anchored protein [Micrococcales bacterium 31B]
MLTQRYPRAKATLAARRSTRILAAGAAAALALTGVAVAVGLNEANAASIPSTTTVNTATGGTSFAVGDTIKTTMAYTGLQQGQRYQMISKLVDVNTGAEVSRWYGAVLNAAPGGTGSWNLTYPAPTTAAGKTVQVINYIFPFQSVNGTEAWPTSIKAGYPLIAAGSGAQNLTIAPVAVPAPGTSTVQPGTPTQQIAYTAANQGTPPSGNVPEEVVTSPVTGATLSTLATDKADGDKQLVSNGTVVDVVKYTGLNPGTIYVLHTQLFNKTDNVLTSFTKATIFTPSTRDGEVRVEFPLPAGLEGKELVVYQTIYAGADALVGKHLDHVEVRPGATPVVAENNPGSRSQWVIVKTPPQVCAISGYVWKDANNNSLFDQGEQPVGGVRADARVLNAAGTNFPGVAIAGSAVTDATGFYRIEVPSNFCGSVFVDFNEGQYPAGWAPFSGGDSDLQAGQNGEGGWTGAYQLALGKETTRVDAGLRQKSAANIGISFCDAYDNGYTMKLINAANNGVVQTLTGTQRQFTNVPSGRYWVYFVRNHTENQYLYALKPGGSVQWTHNGNYAVEAGTYEFNYTSGDLTTLQACGSVVLSPLSLDLNGNGQIDTSNIDAQPAGATFDLLGTGSPVASGWLAGGDGFLVKPSADGTVTSRANLFGGALGQGFAQLADADANGDGRVAGSELAGLAVWVDANGDHSAQANEISSLASAGITSLNVDYANAPVVNNGNVIVEHGSATAADGSSVLLADAYFTANPGTGASNAAAVNALTAATQAHLAGLPASERDAIARAFASAH